MTFLHSDDLFPSRLFLLTCLQRLAQLHSALPGVCRPNHSRSYEDSLRQQVNFCEFSCVVTVLQVKHSDLLVLAIHSFAVHSLLVVRPKRAMGLKTCLACRVPCSVFCCHLHSAICSLAAKRRNHIVHGLYSRVQRKSPNSVL